MPPGQGELGRVSIAWDPVPGAAGYRIYSRDCDGTVRAALDLGLETSFGPVQPCRPSGDIVVSAAGAGGESVITWANP